MTEWSCLEARPSLQLFSIKLDIDFGGFLFAEPVLQPTLYPNEVLWHTLAADLGLAARQPSLPLPQASTQLLPTVRIQSRTPGVVLLLGIGSYICYRLYKLWVYQRRQGRDSDRDKTDSSPPPSASDSTPAFSFHPLNSSSSTISDFLNVQTRYFGPVHLNDDSYSENETHCQDITTSPESASGGSQCRARERRRRYRQLTSPPSVYNTSSRRAMLSYKHRNMNTDTDTCSSKYSSRRDTAANSTGCSSSTGSSPISFPHQHSLSRDLSFDSLGLFQRHREGSIDSISSDFSFDMPSFSDQNVENGGTVQKMQELLEEIDQLKHNCLDQQEEFESVKCNRNLPGLSELMEVSEHPDTEFSVQQLVRQQNARACFKGLYSLTPINKSMSLDLSIDEDSPQSSNQFNLSQVTEEEQYPSLEWDEEYGSNRETDETVVEIDSEQPKNCRLQFSQGNNNGSQDFHNGTESLENCMSDSWIEARDLSTSPNMLHSSGYNSRMDFSNSFTSSQFSTLGSPMSPFEDVPDNNNKYLQRSVSLESEEGSWSVSAPAESPISEETPVVTTQNSARPANVGPRVPITRYAEQEWTGNTPKALTILRGYKEIEEKMQYRYLRQIRGDNYCALRSTVFQTLVQGLPVPSSAKTLDRLSHTHNIGSQWRFNGLPYSSNNVFKGMEICLQSLDNISTLLRNSERSLEEREETVYNLLNTDVSLDQHIMEAMKLHMMATALDLHEAYTRGANVPLFAILLFARDTSEVPLDFMNNHLLKVGDSGGLEQNLARVEMFLLGYMLGVTLKVVRPSAHGTSQFVCYYPDDFVGQWPEVTLIAEDDRHFNILCL